MDDEFLTVDEISRWIRLTSGTIRKLTKRGVFPRPVRIARFRVVWRRADIEAWLDARQAPDAPELPAVHPIDIDP